MTSPTAFPLKILAYDLDAPQGDVVLGQAEDGMLYVGAMVFVRKGRAPLGLVEVAAQEGRILAASIIEAAACVSGYDRALRRVIPSAVPGRESVSVIIATRNRPSMLARCLESLLAQTFMGFDAVVVDNHPSDDSTHEMMRARFADYSQIRYVREDMPGLAIAHNRGLKESSGSLVAITDDDVVADRHWLETVVASFQSSEDVGCVTGLILPAELETRAQVWTEMHGGFGKGMLPRSFDLKTNRPSGPLFPFTAGQFGSGANMAFRRAALRKIGNFNPALGAGTIARGGDDLASFYNIVSAGYCLNYEPAAVVWHYHRREEEGMERQAFNYGRGLGAYLSSVLAANPAVLARLAIALPAGLAHMFGARADRNTRLPVDYPRRLKQSEIFGILSGFPAYTRSAWATPGSYWQQPGE